MSTDPAAFGLASAETTSEAADLLGGHLEALGFPLNSIYVVQSGVLRCFGSRGYAQILDGLNLDDGVIGSTIRRGKPQVIDPRTDPNYIVAAIDSVVEICVPIFSAGEVVGAVDVESPEQLRSDAVELLEAAAASLGTFLEHRGPLRDPQHWQQLADTALTLSLLRDVDEIAERTLQLAIRISGFDSGVIALPDDQSVLHIRAAEQGQHASALPGDAMALEEVRLWLARCRTASSISGGTRRSYYTGLRQPAGLQSVFSIATRVPLGEDRMGYIFLVTNKGFEATPRIGQQLELLAALAGGAVATTESIGLLTIAATRDPLTGLPHRRAFGEILDDPVEGQPPLVVLAIDVDHLKQVNDRYGHEAGDHALVTMTRAIQDVLESGGDLYRLGGDEFAVVVGEGIYGDVSALARRVTEATHLVGVPVSVGAAVARPGVPVAAAYGAADAALLAAKRAGRNGFFVAD